jgi:hypothetical protein
MPEDKDSTSIYNLLSRFVAPALSEKQKQAFSEVAYNDAWKRPDEDIKSFERTMLHFFRIGITPDAMKQAIDNFEREATLAHIVANHEVNCKVKT